MAAHVSSAPRLNKTLLPSGRVYRLERRSNKSLMRRLRSVWRSRQG
jgi:hypothetical protein